MWLYPQSCVCVCVCMIVNRAACPETVMFVFIHTFPVIINEAFS